MKKTDFSFYDKGKQLYYEQLARSFRGRELQKPDYWMPFEKDIEEAKIAFVSVAEAYLDDQEPFTEEGKDSDYDFRKIDSDYEEEDLNFLGSDWDTSEAEEDPNVIFPIKNLVLLQKEGVIGEVDNTVYSFSGHHEDAEALQESIETVIEELKEKEVDAAIVVPASVDTCEVAWEVCNELEGSEISTAMLHVFYEQLLNKPAPRTAYINFPFGRPFGPADSRMLNTAILRDILRLFEKNKRPARILSLNYIWSWGDVSTD